MFSKKGNQHSITVISPEHPIKRSFYRCDSVFYTECIQALYQTLDEYHMVLHLKGQCSTFYRYTVGLEHLEKVGKYDTKLQNNHSRGGQSQNRIMRLRENSVHEYLKSVQEKLSSVIDEKCIGLLIAGHGTKPQQFKQYLSLEQKDLLLEVLITEHITIEQVLRIVKGKEYVKTKQEEDNLEQIVQTEPDKLAFGEDEVNTLLLDGMLSAVYDSIDNTERRERCKEMGCAYHVIPFLRYTLCAVKWY